MTQRDPRLGPLAVGRFISRRRLLAAIPVLGVVAAVGCGDDGDGPAAGGETPQATPTGPTPSPTPSTRTVTTPHGAVVVPSNPQRIVALGEEFMLANLLDLGVKPIASTASASDGTFILWKGAPSLIGIQTLSNAEPDFEKLVALQPDLIVSWKGFAERVGLDRLGRIAPTVTVNELGGFRQTYRDLAAIFGKDADAAARIATYEGSVKAAGTELRAAGRKISVATIFPGGSITVYSDTGADAPSVILDMGFRLSPDKVVLPPTRSLGRVAISLEQLNVLQGDTIVLVQSGAIEGEDAAVREVTANPLFRSLPAAVANRVRTVDRFGFPGLFGRIALVEELKTLLRPA
jgi:iron complex transport system substrate-binding protein